MTPPLITRPNHPARGVQWRGDDTSILPLHTPRRHVGWEGDPGVARFFPNCDCGRGKFRIGESSDGNGDVAWETFTLPAAGGAARRAEVEREHVTALGRAGPRGGHAGNGDLLATEARLVADHGAGAALTLQAMAHGDARGLALDGEVELATAAGGAVGGH